MHTSTSLSTFNFILIGLAVVEIIEFQFTYNIYEKRALRKSVHYAKTPSTSDHKKDKTRHCVGIAVDATQFD